MSPIQSRGTGIRPNRCRAPDAEQIPQMQKAQPEPGEEALITKMTPNPAYLHTDRLNYKIEILKARAPIRISQGYLKDISRI